MDALNRRELLAAVAGASSVALAGCTSDSDDEDAPANSTETSSNAPESSLSDSELPDCPEYDTERTICYDSADPEEAPGILEPSARSLETDESISFALQNNSDSTLNTNFFNWRLDKHVDGEWYHVAPQGYNQPLMYLQPGESHEWTLRVDNAGIEDGELADGLGGRSDLTISGLGGGHYAFRGRGWFDEETHEDDTAFAATFELDAEQIELTPTENIEDTEWDGETLVATSARGDSDSEFHRRGAFELERVSDPPASEKRILEQVLRYDRLRDAIALANEYDAERVRLEEYNERTPIFGARTDKIYEFQGSYYEISTHELA